VNDVERFRVPPGTTVKLEDIDPSFKNHHEGHKEAAREIEHYQKKLRNLQELLYVDGRRSPLICLQALDAGGKDGTISGRSARPITRSEPTGTTTRRLTKMHSPVAAQSMPLGSLFLPTTSGSETSPWPGSSSSTWKG
jgi:polyphosphate kinase 2 (PPK2 family)